MNFIHRYRYRYLLTSTEWQKLSAWEHFIQNLCVSGEIRSFTVRYLRYRSLPTRSHKNIWPDLHCFLRCLGMMALKSSFVSSGWIFSSSNWFSRSSSSLDTGTYCGRLSCSSASEKLLLRLRRRKCRCCCCCCWPSWSCSWWISCCCCCT